MLVSRSGYYKWKYRQEHPTQKMISRQSDIELIKEIHKKHPSHGYRWINAYARLHYGIVWSDNHVHLCCKYEGIRSKGKHYQWRKPNEEHETFNNLVWNGWKALTRPFEVIISDMTRFDAIISGTSPDAISCANPSTIAVFPTPGSPIKHGLFLFLLDKI